jgi:undecaprenyl diphosphate synthase
MDGNGRWAQNRHMLRSMGHAKGASIVRGLVEYCSQLGIQYLTLFAFSTENWKRPKDEVSTIMELFIKYLEKELKNLSHSGVRFKVIGDISLFDKLLQEKIIHAVNSTSQNTKIVLTLAANYGGRWDVVNAFQRWLQDNPSSDVSSFSEQQLQRYLSTFDLPDPDLLIRTGGEQRISNFLLWQIAYSELYFTEVLWPEFDNNQLEIAISWYKSRQRRFGKVAL